MAKIFAMIGFVLALPIASAAGMHIGTIYMDMLLQSRGTKPCCSDSVPGVER